MKTEVSPATSLERLRELTPARVALGVTGVSLPTKALLEFTLDHARARDAVHAAFDAEGVLRGLADLGLEAIRVSSQAPTRKDYLARPDLGRKLDAIRRPGWRTVAAEESSRDRHRRRAFPDSRQRARGRSAANAASVPGGGRHRYRSRRCCDRSTRGIGR